MSAPYGGYAKISKVLMSHVDATIFRTSMETRLNCSMHFWDFCGVMGSGDNNIHLGMNIH